MANVRRISLSSLHTGIAACTSRATTETGAPQPSAPEPAAQPASAAGSAKTALLYFQGDVDVATSIVTLTFRTPEGKIVDQAAGTLPYGTGGNGVYFHTCGVPTYTHVGAGGHLDGLVQAVNNMTKPRSRTCPSR